MKLKPINEQVIVLMGASSGIGRKTALEMAKKGAKVVVSARSQDALDTLVSEIRQQGGEATAVAADVAEFDQVKNVADTAAQTYGRIDTWVHLAGVTIFATFEETQPEEFKRLIDVNLTGQAFGAMAALPYLKKEGRGALIHISSVEAKRSLPLQSAYSASKHGIAGFLDSLRMELQHEGVQVSVTNIIPSSINTPLYEKAVSKIGVEPKPIPPIYEPEIVSEAILYAAEHPVRELYVGGAGKFLGLVQRISPKTEDVILEQVAFSAQRTDEPQSPYERSNLFKHLEGYDTIRGDFTEQARPRSVYTWFQTHPVAKWGLASALVAAGGFAAGFTVINRMRSKRPVLTGAALFAGRRILKNILD